MKAGSLQRMTISVLCESPRDRHPQEKCASKCVRGIVLSAFIYFLARSDLESEISTVRSEISNRSRMCGLAAKAPSFEIRRLTTSWVRVLPHAPKHCRLPIADFRLLVS